MTLLVTLKFDMNTERAYFLHQYVEGFRHAWLHLQISIYDILIHAVTTLNVIRLNRQHFLQGVTGISSS